MSYIICSNIENGDSFDNGGFSNPASFLNNFRSPLIIDKDSEVAVESVKIERSDKWDIKADNNFFLYFGEDQVETTKPSGEVVKNGVRIDINVGSYNVEEMTIELERAINNSPIGPAIWGNCSVKALVNGANSTFAGFSFEVKPRGVATSRHRDIEETSVIANNRGTVKFVYEGNLTDPKTPPFTYVKGTGVLTNNKTVAGATFSPNNTTTNRNMRSQSSVRLNDYPLANSGGKFRVNILNASLGAFQVGLTRPTTPYYQNGFPSEVSPGKYSTGSAKQSGFTYMDYWIEWRPDDNEVIVDGVVATLGALYVFKWGMDATNSNMKEIKYYERTTPDIDIKLTKAKWAELGIKAVEFELDGEELKLSLIGELGDPAVETPYILIDSSTDTARTKNFPPQSNITEALLPTIASTLDGQIFTVEQYDAHVLTNWKNISVANLALSGPNYPANTSVPIAGSDWYSNAIGQIEVRGEIQSLLNRPSLYPTGGAGTYKYVKKNASDVIPYLPTLIVGQETVLPGVSEYEQVYYVIPIPRNVNKANMNRELGFGKWSVIGSAFRTVSAEAPLTGQILTSIDAGEYTVHSAFIRINDLPIQSFNGATSSRSNILYHIPRFSNDGRQHGDLFFPVPEKTYLKIGNTEKMTINQLQIDIVGRNERLVSDLKGSTIVCLHIRKSK